MEQFCFRHDITILYQSRDSILRVKQNDSALDSLPLLVRITNRLNPWRTALPTIEAERPGVAHLVANEGFCFRHALSHGIVRRPEGKPHQGTALGVVFPEPDDRTPVQDCVAGEV